MLNTISLLNQEYNILGSIRDNSPEQIKEQMIDVFTTLTSNLNNVEANNYPRYSFRSRRCADDEIRFNCNTIKFPDGFGYDNSLFLYHNQFGSKLTLGKFMKVINLLIWAVAKHGYQERKSLSLKNDYNLEFGMFISAYNLAKVLEHHHASAEQVAIPIVKYISENDIPVKFALDDLHAFDYQLINLDLQGIAQHFLNNEYNSSNDTDRDDGNNNIVPNGPAINKEATMTESKQYQRTVLQNIVEIGNSNYNRQSTAKSVMAHANQIAKHGTDDLAVQSLLAKHHIITGQKLMEHLVQGISYNRNFSENHNYGIAISKVANPNALYVYHKNDSWSVQRVNGKYIKQTITNSLHARKHLKEALQKQHKIAQRIKHLRSAL